MRRLISPLLRHHQIPVLVLLCATFRPVGLTLFIIVCYAFKPQRSFLKGREPHASIRTDIPDFISKGYQDAHRQALSSHDKAHTQLAVCIAAPSRSLDTRCRRGRQNGCTVLRQPIDGHGNRSFNAGQRNTQIIIHILLNACLCQRNWNNSA